MRSRWSLLGVSTLFFAFTIAAPPDQNALAATSTEQSESAAPTASEVAGTVFNEKHVPPYKMLTGKTINEEIKEGNW